MKTRNIFFACALFMVVSAAAQAQVKDSIAVADTTTVSSSTIAGAMVGGLDSESFARRCGHLSIQKGRLSWQSCSGLYVAPVVRYSTFNYKNESGSDNTSGAEFGLAFGYRYILNHTFGLKPEVYGTGSTTMDFEGLKARALECGAKIGLEIGTHSAISVTVGPQVAYHNVKSLKNIETDDYMLQIPYTGNCFLYGAYGEIGFKLGTFRTAKNIQVGNRVHRGIKKHQIRGALEISYLHGSVDKPVNGTLKLNKLSIGGKVSFAL